MNKIVFTGLLLCIQSLALSQMHFAASVSAPKALRHGDQIEIPVKLFNNRTQELKGSIQFMLTDSNNVSIDGWTQNMFPVQHYSINAKDSAEFFFPIAVPHSAELKKIRYAVVGTNDTLKSGSINILSNDHLKIAGKVYQASVQMFLIKNSKNIELQPETDVHVGDTIMIATNVEVFIPYKSYEAKLSIPANTIPCGIKPIYKVKGTSNETKMFAIVAYAGKCSVDGVKVTTDGKQYFLPLPYTVRCSRK